VRRQRLEMRVLVPGGLAFNLVAWLIVRGRPEAAPILAVAQLVSSVLFVVSFVRSFDERQRRISANAEATP
jgi:hypothetical protein